MSIYITINWEFKIVNKRDNENTEEKREIDAQSVQSNWYEDGFEERKAKLREAGEIKNNAFKEYLKVSKKYDQLKRNFYNLTDAAVDEAVISEEGSAWTTPYIYLQNITNNFALLKMIDSILPR